MGIATTMAEPFLMATAENLQEVVALLRPDLCLMPRRALDAALTALIDAKRG